jgi:hypothetical protein
LSPFPFAVPLFLLLHCVLFATLFIIAGSILPITGNEFSDIMLLRRKDLTQNVKILFRSGALFILNIRLLTIMDNLRQCLCSSGKPNESRVLTTEQCLSDCIALTLVSWASQDGDRLARISTMPGPSCSCFVIDGVDLLRSRRRGVVIKVTKFNIFNLFTFLFYIYSRNSVISPESTRVKVSTPIDGTEDMRQNISAPAHLYKPHSLSLLLQCFILSTLAHNRLYLNLFRLHVPALNDIHTSLYWVNFFPYKMKVSLFCICTLFYIKICFPWVLRSLE